MSQKTFGKPLEIGKSRVCQIEKGNTIPSKSVMKLFFQVYSVNPDWFYNDNGPMIIGPNPTHPTNPKPQGAMSVTESKVQLLLEQARYVLASGPEKYAQALSHVIVGFLGAVEAEEERKECRTQLGELTDWSSSVVSIQ